MLCEMLNARSPALNGWRWPQAKGMESLGLWHYMEELQAPKLHEEK